MFNNIIGHNRIKSFLQNSIQKNHLSHSYLFSGAEHLGKFTLALEFAKELIKVKNENYPDILILKSEKNIINIKDIRELQRKLNLSPYQAKYKIAIIDNAHFLRKESANALLKTLEEPPKQGIIILIANSLNSILPTIISRCQVFKFWPVPNDEIRHCLQQRKVRADKAEKIMNIAYNRPGTALCALENSSYLKEQDKHINAWQNMLKSDLITRFKYAEKLSKDKEHAQAVLQAWILNLRNELLKKPERLILLYLKNLQETIYLLGTNTNSRLALENMMLKL